VGDPELGEVGVVLGQLDRPHTLCVEAFDDGAPGGERPAAIFGKAHNS
jgi:hypothetical protein